MAKAHIWAKNDKITAERLNSMARPLNKILQGGGKDESTDKPHGDSDTANWANAIDDAQPVQHEWANHVGYRHPTYGTADLYDTNLPIGMYATAPTIVDGIGNIQQDITHFGCMPCYLAMSQAACSETVYLHYKTNNKGGLISLAGSDNKKAEYIVGSAGCNQIFGLNVGTGDFYAPIAKYAPDPKFSCQKMAMHYAAVQVPIIADDASYLPPYNSNTRGIQGMKIADALEQSIVPIRGINNHGGVKILPSYDTDGTRTSNALMASPEIYGRATCEDWKCDGCGVGSNQSVFQADFITTGTDENGNTNTTCETWYFYQQYNRQYPFAFGDGGLLAKWPIYQAVFMGCNEPPCKRKIGELRLIGGHIPNEDWQIWYQGCGEIILPHDCKVDIGALYDAAGSR